MAPASIAFRTVASKAIGFGHLRRCLTLAGELQTRRGDVGAIRFWIDGDPAAVAVAQAAGFEASAVAGPEPATTAARVKDSGTDRLIVDSYELRDDTFAAWRPAVACLIAIDDLADRFLEVDLVVNASPQAARLIYRTPPDCRLLLGPACALLRPQFRNLRPRAIGERVERVLVTLGGADPGGSTTAVVAATLRALPDAAIDAVAGPLFGRMPELDAMAARTAGRVAVHAGLDDLKPLMMAADIAVSGGGQTLFELAATGLPAVAVCLAPNQEPNIAALDRVTLLAAGPPPDASAPVSTALEQCCHRLADDRNLRATLSRSGQALVDGEGAARVADVILGRDGGPPPGDHLRHGRSPDR